MKKLLVLALASVSILSSIPSLHAADVKFSGEFRVRAFYAENVDDFNDDASPDDQQAFSDERFRLRTNVTSGIASGVIALDITNGTGATTEVATFQNAGSLGAGSGNTRLGTAGFGHSYNVVGVREAYLKFQFPMFGATAGRSPFKLGHGLILDDTADAISVNGGIGGVRVMVADLKLCDTDASPLACAGGTGSDSDFYLVNLGFSHMDQHMIGLFAGYLKDRGSNLLFNGVPAAAVAPGGTSTELYVFGASAEGNLGMIRLGLEADYLTGEFKDAGVDLKGMNLMANAGVMVGPADVGLLVIYGTGDDGSADERNVNSISPNFVLGNILLNNGKTSDREGSAPNFAGLGILAVKLSAGFKHMPLGLPGGDVAVIWAQTAEDTAAGNKDIGIEVDLNFHHRFDESLMLNVGLGYLMPGDAVSDISGGFDDNAFQAGAGLSYTF